LRRLTADRAELAIVRYFLHAHDEPGENNKPRRVLGIAAMVFRSGRAMSFAGAGEPEQVVCPLDYQSFTALTRERHADGPSGERARRLWEVMIEPLWRAICLNGTKLPEHLVLIPTTGMFGLPLHTALVPKESCPGSPPEQEDLPLAALLPLSFSVSATAFATRRRYLLRKQPVDAEDDLCALVPGDPDIYPGEIAGADWRDDGHFHVAGNWPAELPRGSFQRWGDGDLAGFRGLLSRRAEFFVYAGHGCSVSSGSGVEVALKLANGDFLTQYDLVTTLSFRRNKWTILGACVSGQGADTVSGEVSGFLRAFMAAGVGALCVTLWKVKNDAIAHVGGKLLARAAECKRNALPGSKRPEEVNVDVVKELCEVQREAFLRALRAKAPSSSMSRDLPPEAPVPSDPLGEALHACPLVVYL
jgi:hypothetical protein